MILDNRRNNRPTYKQVDNTKPFPRQLKSDMYGYYRCAICGKDLVHNHITKDDGTQVGVSECPDGCGKIKSPMCCGHDMSCDIN